MKKGIICLLTCLLGVTMLVMGCGNTDEPEGKIKNVEFTVVELEDIPQELLDIIEENKSGEMKMTWEGDGYLYAIRGYGQQKTGGYSIAAEECYLAKEGIWLKTSLIGPPHDKKIQEEPSYPFIVVKMQHSEEPVTFL